MTPILTSPTSDLLRLVSEQHLSLHQSTPLYMAAEGGHMDVVKYLGDKGADINRKNKNGVMHQLLQFYFELAFLLGRS